MAVDFRRETVTGLAAKVASRELTARELTETALVRIDESDSAVNAFVLVDGDGAITEAVAIDRAIAGGDAVGPLAGVPLAVKDLVDVAGMRTTHGSLAHRDDPPAARDATLVERLRGAGCVIVGKTNTPEHGWKGDTSNRLFGATRNPWSLGRSPGGSSGGSAAAIAAGMVPLATGSDGGGSIRIPSSLCGLSGFKPSLGRVPNGGPEPPGWLDLSTAGVMARRIRDIAFALDAVIGPDPTDLRSLPLPDARWGLSLDELHPPRRVAWAPTLGYAPVDREVLAACDSAVQRLASLGTEIVVVDDLFDADPVLPWAAIVAACCLRSNERFIDTDAWDLLDPGLVAQMEYARSSLSALDLVKAIDTGHRLNARLVELFHEVSLLLCPTVAGQAPAAGEATGTINGASDINWVRFTYPFNLTCSPAGTVCAGFTDDGVPIGLQVVGPQHGDVVVLRLLAVLEDLLAIEAVAPLR